MNGTPPILESIAVMASTAIVAGFIVYTVAYALSKMWRRVWDAATPLQLGEMLYRQGDRVARAAIAPGGNDFVLAVRQCTSCKAAAQCRAWLDSGEREGYGAFCPNAGFVDRMKHIAL
jgi:Family of unknown function (DUF6455)